MTAAEVVSIVTGAEKVDRNVFNFFFNYKEFEPLLVVNKKKPLTDTTNSLLERDTLIQYINDPTKPQYNKRFLIKIFDEVKYKMTWYSISNIYMSTQVMFDCERYDFNNIKEISENVYTLLDRTTGERIFIAADQTNEIVQYSYNDVGEEINEKTGEVEKNVLVNQGKDKCGTDKHRNAMYFRD